MVTVRDTAEEDKNEYCTHNIGENNRRVLQKSGPSYEKDACGFVYILALFFHMSHDYRSKKPALQELIKINKTTG